MNQETIEELLVEWEVARQAGHEVGLAELCAEHPELQDEIRRRVEKLRSTSWMLDDATDGDQASACETAVPNRAQASNRDFETLADSDVTVAEFVSSVASSGVMTESELARLQQDYLPQLRDPLAGALAQQLVFDGLLTDYQAAVLLNRKDGPLLLDRYVILDVVGSGGMGLVFKALHRSMERIVALKMLPPWATDSPDKITRFAREIKATAKLSHPNIVAAYDAHEVNGTCFLVMEYVDGMNLREYVQEHGPVSPELATRIAAQMASALSEAHRLEIVHRDIKPSNVLLSQSGTAKLLDLGLARANTLEQLDGPGTLTRDGLAMGTVAFMSPEQALDAKQADARSDVYSLGCTLYFLLVGRSPFERESAVQTIIAHREEQIPSLTEERPDVPASLDGVFARMVAKDAGDRYPSMDAVRADLLACELVSEADLHGRTRPAEPGKQARPLVPRQPSRPARKWALVGVVLCLIVLATLAGSQWFQGDSQREVAQWVLGAGGTVEVESEFGTQQLFDLSELPETAFQVTGVDLSEANVAIKSLSTLKQLRWLSVMDVSIHRHQVKELALLPQLVDLQLTACSISDQDLPPLAGMTQLESLDLSNNQITDVGMQHLAGLSNLTVLYLNNTRLTDAGMTELAQLTALVDLDISGTEVTGQGLRQLGRLTNLTDLDLQGMSLSPQDTASLAELQQLRFLVLDFCDISDEAIEHLQALQNLESLYLEDTNLGAAGMVHLARLGKLRQLDLRGSKLSGDDLKPLSQLAHLQDLWLGEINLSEESLEVIASLKHLETLDLSGSNLDDQMLRKLGDLQQLRSLVVADTDVTREGINWAEGALPNCSVSRRRNFYWDDVPTFDRY